MNKNGSVLMITLWILTILVIFALGLGHRASINLRLVRNQRDRLKAFYLAKAGINKAIAILEEDAVNPETKDYDTLDACGVNLKNKKPEDIFSQKLNTENETFKIGYEASSGEFIYGFRDEESRININNINNKALLVELFKLQEIENYEELADTIVDWIDDNDIDSKSGAKENEVFKNAPLKITAELLPILEYFYQNKGLKDYRNKAQEVYRQLKDLSTVYGSNKININTASREVLQVLFDGDTGNLADIVVNFRKDGGIFNREDAGDIIDKLNNFGGNLTDQQEEIIRQLITDNLITIKSDNFKIESTGNVNNITKNITAIYDRGNKIISYWHEN